MIIHFILNTVYEILVDISQISNGLSCSKPCACIPLIRFEIKLSRLACICFLDLDECSSGNSSCVHNCTNNNGSFACSCIAGYTLNADQISCDGKTSSFVNTNSVRTRVISMFQHKYS